MTQPRASKRQLVTRWITVPANFEQGCDHFNQGRFFECHESFEEVWQEEQGEVRDLYKGLIQIAAAFVHLTRGNFTGAERLLRTALGYLESYRVEEAMGFDVATICRSTEDVHARLIAAGPAAVHTLDLAERPRYAFDSASLPAEAIRWSAWGFDARGHPMRMQITVAE